MTDQEFNKGLPLVVTRMAPFRTWLEQRINMVQDKMRKMGIRLILIRKMKRILITFTIVSL